MKVWRHWIKWRNQKQLSHLVMSFKAFVIKWRQSDVKVPGTFWACIQILVKGGITTHYLENPRLSFCRKSWFSIFQIFLRWKTALLQAGVRDQFCNWSFEKENNFNGWHPSNEVLWLKCPLNFVVNTSSPIVNTSCPVVNTSSPTVITSLSYTEYYNFLQSTIVRTIVFTSLCGKL